MGSVRLIKAEGLRRILVAVFYLAFIMTMVYCLMYPNQADDRILYAVLLLFVPFGVLYEVIRFFFAKASDGLNKECDPEQARRYVTRVRRLDFLKRYRTQLAYLDGFITLDENRIKAEIDNINDQLLRLPNSNRKLDFQYNYLLFSCYVELCDKKNTAQYYDAVRKIIGLRERPGNDLISLGNFVYGIYNLFEKNYDKAQNAFNKVKPQDLSERERARYYFYSARLSARMGDTEEMEKNYQTAIELAPAIQMITANKPRVGGRSK